MTFFIQLTIDNQFVTDPKHIADAFGNYFESMFNTFCPSSHFLERLRQTSSSLLSSELLISKATNRLAVAPSICVGLDAVPSLTVGGCCDIFIPLLT
jgi:hypothetical protein